MDNINADIICLVEATEEIYNAANPIQLKKNGLADGGNMILDSDVKNYSKVPYRLRQSGLRESNMDRNRYLSITSEAIALFSLLSYNLSTFNI